MLETEYAEVKDDTVIHESPDKSMPSLVTETLERSTQFPRQAGCKTDLAGSGGVAWASVAPTGLRMQESTGATLARVFAGRVRTGNRRGLHPASLRKPNTAAIAHATLSPILSCTPTGLRHSRNLAGLPILGYAKNHGHNTGGCGQD